VFVVLFTFGDVRAHAQQVDLWLPSAAPGGRVDARELEVVFGEVLGGTASATHAVGAGGIAAALERNGFVAPRCLAGLDAPCPDPVVAAARAVGATRAIWAAGRQPSSTGPFFIDMTVVDLVRGERQRVEVEAVNIREAVFAAVGALTQATATLSVSSDPTGAAVRLDGRALGTTPFQATLPIGAYNLEVVLDGFYVHGTPIELRSGDARDEHITLQRRFAVVIIETSAPGAVIRVGDDQTFPPNEPFQLLPGEHVIRIEAPGHDTEERTVELAALEERRYRVTLTESEATIARRKLDTIRARRLSVQAGFAGSATRTTLLDARTRFDSATRRVQCPIAEPLDAACSDDRVAVGQVGLDVVALYHVGWLELQLAGLGVRSVGPRGGRADLRVDDDRADTLRIRRGREFFVRLPGVGVRWLTSPDLSVGGRTGLAFATQRLAASTARDFDAAAVRRTDLLWTFDVAARYHLSSTFFGYAEIDIAAPINRDGTRTRLGAGLGVGLTLPDPVRWRHRPAPATRATPPGAPTPAEL